MHEDNIKSGEVVACFGDNCEPENQFVKQLKKELRIAEFIGKFKERERRRWENDRI